MKVPHLLALLTIFVQYFGCDSQDFVQDLLTVLVPCFTPQCYPEIGCIKPFISFIGILFPPISVCAQSPEKVQTTFNVITSSNPPAFTSLENLQSGGTLAFFTHGCTSSFIDKLSLAAGFALLYKYDQVVLVDWEKGANQDVLAGMPVLPINVFLCAANSETVGRLIANAINYAVTAKGIDPSSITITGHSGGSHTTHFTGEWLRERYNTRIKELIALEPSTPPFAYSNKDFPEVGDADFTNRIMTTFNPPVPLISDLFVLDFKFGYPFPTTNTDLFVNLPAYYNEQLLCIPPLPICSHCFSIAVMVGALKGCLFQQTSCLPLYQDLPGSRTGVPSSIYGNRGPICIRTTFNPFLTCQCSNLENSATL